MNKTAIEWSQNPDGTPGYTWNPITGCNNQVDGLCGGKFPCYAYKLANTRLKERYLSNKNTATQNYDEDSYPFYPRYWPEKFKDLANMGNKAPRGIFVCSMSDLFGIGVPEEWTRNILEAIGNQTRHRFYLLTKQPQNLIKFSPFPGNCYVGVSATNSFKAIEAIEYLDEIEAKVKFLSLEPLLDWQPELIHFTGDVINWIIIGAQTKPTVMPKVEWVQEIVEAADKAGIPVFLKDSLKPLLCTTVNGQDLIESHNLWAFKYFKLRQEMPE